VKSVKDYIPHRDPFLFVDRILELSAEGVVTELTVRADFPFFEGHYPGFPLMPGVLLCEAVFQSAGVFMSGSRAGMDSQMPILSKITNARFKRMVTPGEVLRIEVTPIESQGPFHMMRGKITNSEKALVMSVEFTITQKTG
jgi:3-hydroxyacyl-[acyl-carrier-protein] dehydratase